MRDPKILQEHILEFPPDVLIAWDYIPFLLNAILSWVLLLKEFPEICEGLGFTNKIIWQMSENSKLWFCIKINEVSL